jgi:hypothetical protein
MERRLRASTSSGCGHATGQFERHARVYPPQPEYTVSHVVAFAQAQQWSRTTSTWSAPQTGAGHRQYKTSSVAQVTAGVTQAATQSSHAGQLLVAHESHVCPRGHESASRHPAVPQGSQVSGLTHSKQLSR